MWVCAAPTMSSSVTTQTRIVVEKAAMLGSSFGGPPGPSAGTRFGSSGDLSERAPGTGLVEAGMRRVVRTLAKMLAVILLVSSSSALAEPPTPKDKARARELYAMGQQMFRQADYTGAQKSFEEAYKAVPNPIVLLSIAECQVRTQNF